MGVLNILWEYKHYFSFVAVIKSHVQKQVTKERICLGLRLDAFSITAIPLSGFTTSKIVTSEEQVVKYVNL